MLQLRSPYSSLKHAHEYKCETTPPYAALATTGVNKVLRSTAVYGIPLALAVLHCSRSYATKDALSLEKWDPHHRNCRKYQPQVYEHNFPGSSVTRRSIEHLSVEDVDGKADVWLLRFVLECPWVTHEPQRDENFACRRWDSFSSNRGQDGTRLQSSFDLHARTVDTPQFSIADAKGGFLNLDLLFILPLPLRSVRFGAARRANLSAGLERRWMSKTIGRSASYISFLFSKL